MPTTYCGQKYSKLKKKAQKTKILFVDNVFAAIEKSLSLTAGKYGKIEWKRPKDICSPPKFHEVKTTVDDLSQGQHGNHAFISACSCLTTYKAFWQKVVPNTKEQEWEPKNEKKYAGIFHFSIWHNGDWLDIVVDDQLPTINGKLVFAHSPRTKVFWSSLLEKAYAKLLGSYDHLGEADMVEILENFTGGLGKVSDVSPDDDSQERLFRTLKEEVDNKSLIPAIVTAPIFSKVGTAESGGLLMGHGYGVTAVKRVTFTGTPLLKIMQQEKMSLIRLRDPWSGNGWTGNFGRGSVEWQACTPVLQKKLGLALECENEFWMIFSDFCHNFTHIVTCHQMKQMSCAVIHSEWAGPNKDGGSIDNKDSFLSNPQIVFTVYAHTDDVTMSLMQNLGGVSKEEPAKDVGKAHAKNTEWTIQTQRNCLMTGFTILKVEENRTYRLHRILDVVKTSEFKTTRSVVLTHRFARGRYILVATTLKPHQHGSFLLRIYTSSGSKAMELQEDKPMEAMCSKACSCIKCCRYPSMLTQVVVLSASGLETGKTEPNLYCIISCEGEKVVTPVCKDTSTPAWNTGAIFYRRYPTSIPVKIQLWNRHMVKDSFLGEIILEARVPAEQEELDWPMYDRRDVTQRKPGHIRIRLTVVANLQGL
ncbi:Calpain-5 [Lamellibrachia satsuma]|nr:Calpain-5 [Lamellibrachia satsuma]